MPHLTLELYGFALLLAVVGVAIFPALGLLYIEATAKFFR